MGHVISNRHVRAKQHFHNFTLFMAKCSGEESGVQGVQAHPKKF